MRKLKKKKVSGSYINGKSQLISVRLPHSMLAALKKRAGERKTPWQAFLKELLAEGLGLASKVESRVYKAPHVLGAVSRLGLKDKSS